MKLQLSRWIWILVFCLPSLAHGQSSLRWMMGGGRTPGKGQPILTPKQRKLAALQKRLKEVRELLSHHSRKEAQEVQTLRRESEVYRKLAAQYQRPTTRPRWRGQLRIHRKRYEIARLAKVSIEHLRQLQIARTSRIQNLRRLRSTLQSLLEAHKNLRSLLVQHYPPSELYQVKKMILRWKEQSRQSRKALTASHKELKDIEATIEKLQGKLDQHRRSLLREIPKAPSPTPAPTSLPSKEHQSDLKMLRDILRLRQFDVLRTQLRMLQTRQEDELFEQETLRRRLELAAYMLKEMNRYVKKTARKARGGVLYVRPLRFRWWTLRATFRRMGSLPGQMMAQFRRIDAPSQWRRWARLSGLHITSLVGLLLLLFGLVAWLVRQIPEPQFPAIQDEPAVLRSLPQLRYLFHRICYENTLTLLATLAFGVALWGSLPTFWAQLLWPWLLAFLAYRLGRSALDTLISDQADTRLWPLLREETALHWRSVGARFLWLSAFLWPLLQNLQDLRFPGSLQDLLGCLYLLYCTVCFYRFIIKEDELLSALPTHTLLERAWIVFLHRVYRYLYVVPLFLLGCYGMGYRNLASYLVQGSLGSLGVLFLVMETQAFLAYFMTRAEPEPDASPPHETPEEDSLGPLEAVVEDIQMGETTIAGDLMLERFLGSAYLILVGLLFLGLGALLLELWRVPGGYRAALGLVRYPFFQMKDVNLSLLSLLKFGLAVGGAYWISKILPEILKVYLYSFLGTTPAWQSATNTLLRYFLIAVGLLAGLQVMGVGLGGFAIFAGILSIGIGFGIQGIANNFISGLIILFGRPIAVGDFIEVGQITGKVNQISGRSTTIVTPSGKRVLLPNSMLVNGQVINWTLDRSYIRDRIELWVPYDSDLPRIEAILKELATQHPDIPATPSSRVRLNNFRNGFMEVRLTVTLADPLTRVRVLSELRVKALKRFREEGIQMAFPVQDLHLSWKQQQEPALPPAEAAVEAPPAGPPPAPEAPAAQKAPEVAAQKAPEVAAQKAPEAAASEASPGASPAEAPGEVFAKEAPPAQSPAGEAPSSPASSEPPKS